jgi:hypothetical protein
MVLKFGTFPVLPVWFPAISGQSQNTLIYRASKQSVKGFTPFARPIIAHIVLFLGTIISVVINRSSIVA